MLKKRWLNAARVLSVHHPCLSGDVQRCQRWPGRRLFRVALRGGVLIESGHGPLSGGYAHDTVPSDRTMAECDRVTQKGNSAGGCNVVARASRMEGRPMVVPECPRAQRRGEGVTGMEKCWSGKKDMK